MDVVVDHYRCQAIQVSGAGFGYIRKVEGEEERTLLPPSLCRSPSALRFGISEYEFSKCKTS